MPNFNVSELLGNLVGQGVKSVNSGGATVIAGGTPMADIAKGIGQGLYGQLDTSADQATDNSNAAMGAKNARMRAGKKEEASGVSSETPADNPEKFILNILLTAAVPYMAEHGTQYLAQNGQFPDPKTLLKGILPSGQNQVGQEDTPEQNPSPQPTEYAQRANQITNPTGPISKLLNAIPGYGVAHQEAMLNNLAKEQEIAGGQPMQQGEVSRAELEVAKKKKEAEEIPLTQEQRATAQANVTKAMTEQRDKTMTRLDDTIKQLSEYRQQIWDKANFLGKGKKIKQIDTQLEKLQAIRGEHLQENFDRDIPNPSKEGKSNKSGTKIGRFTVEE